MYKIQAKKFSLLFVILIVILVLSSIAFILKTPSEITGSEQEVPFKVDQLLIKVLIKSSESFTSPVNIMDVSDEDIAVTAEPKYLLDVASISENEFTLKPGQTKTVYIDFRSFIEEKSITHQPGAYVGSLLVSSGPFTKQIPMIVEIETKDVLFDANLEISAKRREVPLGGYSTVQVTLFNLKRTGLTNVKMDYFIKDIMGNTIMTESETVVVETQATFTKTLDIPTNFNPGDYVFVAQAKYGDSVGTSTFLFKVPEPEEKPSRFGLESYCKTDYCWLGIIIIAISSLIIIIYAYFYFGSFLYDKIKGIKKPFKEALPEKVFEKKVYIKEVQPKEAEKKPEEKKPQKKPGLLIKPKPKIKKIKLRRKTPKKTKKYSKIKTLQKELKGWKAKGYDTKILEKGLNQKEPKKETKKDILKKMKEWQKKGYNTKILEEKLKKFK